MRVCGVAPLRASSAREAGGKASSIRGEDGRGAAPRGLRRCARRPGCRKPALSAVGEAGRPSHSGPAPAVRGPAAATVLHCAFLAEVVPRAQYSRKSRSSQSLSKRRDVCMHELDSSPGVVKRRLARALTYFFEPARTQSEADGPPVARAWPELSAQSLRARAGRVHTGAEEGPAPPRRPPVGTRAALRAHAASGTSLRQIPE